MASKLVFTNTQGIPIVTITISAAQSTATVKIKHKLGGVDKPLPADLNLWSPDGFVTFTLVPFSPGALETTAILTRAGPVGGTSGIVARGTGAQDDTVYVTVEALGSLVWDEAGAVVT